MDSTSTAGAREIRRVSRACVVCRRRKLKCRPSAYPDICQRCVDDGVANECIYVPVNPQADMGNDATLYSMNQGQFYPFAAGNPENPHHYPSHPVSLQTNNPPYFSTGQHGGLVDAAVMQNQMYGRQHDTSYPQQPSAYQHQPPVGTVPPSYPAWPTQGMQYYDQVSQGSGQPAFVTDQPTAGYPVEYQANYATQQGDDPTNNPANWGGAANESYLGYIDPNGNYYPQTQVHHQPDVDSERKE